MIRTLLGALMGTRRAASSSPSGCYDAIVVAGCRVYDDGRLSPALRRRMDHAIGLYSQGLAPIFVVSGRGPGAAVEADAMARYARENDVPEAHLLLERESRNTAENAAFTRAVLRARRIVVVTDAHHVRRCRREFSKWFPEVDGSGVVEQHPMRALWREALRDVFVEPT